MLKLRIGSFNLCNLVLPNHEYYNGHKYSKKEYSKKVVWIRQQIKQMNSHIIGFQEIFHKKALEDALSLTNFRKNDILVMDANGKEPRVGLATAFPVVGKPLSIKKIPEDISNIIEGISEDFKEFSRPILKVKIALSRDLRVTVFVTHLKSERPTILSGENQDDFAITAAGQSRSLIRRAIEASGLRSLILKELSGKRDPVILIGDFNDSNRSITNGIIAGPMPWKDDSFEEKKRYWEKALYNCYDIISQKSLKRDWFTHIYNGHYTVMDHIYVSQEFFFRNKDKIGDVDFVHILSDHLIDDALYKEKLPKWQSDHGQVVVTLSLKPVKAKDVSESLFKRHHVPSPLNGTAIRMNA